MSDGEAALIECCGHILCCVCIYFCEKPVERCSNLCSCDFYRGICSNLGACCTSALIEFFGDRCCCPPTRPELRWGYPPCFCDILPMCFTCLWYDAICEGLSGSHDVAMGGTCVTCECTSSLELLPCCYFVPPCGQLVTDGACCRIWRVGVSVPYYQLQRTTACWCCFCSDQAWSPHGTWMVRGGKGAITSVNCGTIV